MADAFADAVVLLEDQVSRAVVVGENSGLTLREIATELRRIARELEEDDARG